MEASFVLRAVGADDRQEGSTGARKVFKTRCECRDKWKERGIDDESIRAERWREIRDVAVQGRRAERGGAAGLVESVRAQSHTEHQAALDATLFRSASDPYELVLELDSGQLRLRETDPEPS